MIQSANVIGSAARAQYEGKVYDESIKIKLSEEVVIDAYHKSGEFSTNNITGEFSVLFKSENYSIEKVNEIPDKCIVRGGSEWVYDIYGNFVRSNKHNQCPGVSNEHISVSLGHDKEFEDISDEEFVCATILRLDVYFDVENRKVI